MKQTLELMLIIALIQSVTVTLTAAAMGPEYYFSAHRGRQVNDGPPRGFDYNGRAGGLQLLQTPDRVYGGWQADRHRLQQQSQLPAVDVFVRQPPRTASSSGWTPIVGGRPDVTTSPRSASGGHTAVNVSADDERRVDSERDRYPASSQHVNAKIAVARHSDNMQRAPAAVSVFVGRERATAADVGAETENDRPARTNEHNRQEIQNYFIFNDDENNGRAEANESSAAPLQQFQNAGGKTTAAGDFAHVRNGFGDTAPDSDYSGTDFGYHADGDDDVIRADGKSDLQIGTDHRGGNHRIPAATASGPQADNRQRKPDVVRGRPVDEASVEPQNRLVATSTVKTAERRPRPPLIAAVTNATDVGESSATVEDASRHRRRRVQSSTRRPTGEDANADDDHGGYGKRNDVNGSGKPHHRRFTTTTASGEKSAAATANARRQGPRPATDRDEDATAAAVEQKPRVGGAGYGFGYTVTNEHAGMDFGQWERREPGPSGTVTTGQYRVRLPDGRTQTVAYTADPDTGYKASVTYDGVQHYPRTRPSAAERHRHDSTAAETSSG